MVTLLLSVLSGGCTQSPSPPEPADAAVPPRPVASSPAAAATPSSPHSAVVAAHQPSPSPAVATPRPAQQELAFVRDGDVWLAATDGRNAVRLTRSGADSQPSWAPDGRRLVFVRGLGADAELYTITADGSGLRRLTTDRLEQSEPRWAPRGDLIAFVQGRDADPTRSVGTNSGWEIWLVGADGGGLRKLVDGFDPAWSPDGRQVAFATSGQTGDSAAGGLADNALRLVTVPSLHERPLLDLEAVSAAVQQSSDFPFAVASARLRAPSWAADGHHLSASVDGRTALALTFSEQGSEPRAWVLNYQGNVGRTVFAPRGTRLAIESLPATAVRQVVIINTATGNQVEIGSERYDYSAAEPAWAGDGDRLAVVLWRGIVSTPGPRELVIFGSDGVVQTRAAAGNISRPTWNPAR